MKRSRENMGNAAVLGTNVHEKRDLQVRSRQVQVGYQKADTSRHIHTYTKPYESTRISPGKDTATSTRHSYTCTVHVRPWNDLDVFYRNLAYLVIGCAPRDQQLGSASPQMLDAYSATRLFRMAAASRASSGCCSAKLRSPGVNHAPRGYAAWEPFTKQTPPKVWRRISGLVNSSSFGAWRGSVGALVSLGLYTKVRCRITEFLCPAHHLWA
jgi:hypothetical protein